MSHLNVRTNPDDESNLDKLSKTWGISRSEATRKSLAESAARLSTGKRTKMEILEEYGYLGSSHTAQGRKSCETRVKEAIRRKYGR